MKLVHLPLDVKTRLVDHAWEAAKLAGHGSDRGSTAVSRLVESFGEALDGMLRAYEAAGDDPQRAPREFVVR